MSEPTTTTWKHLAPNPKSVYKQLFIKGHRIRARTLYGMFMSARGSRTPEEIAVDYGLPVEAVQEAIAYCQSDPPEIREDFEREEHTMEATGMNDPDYKYGGKYRVLSLEERHPAWDMSIYVDEDMSEDYLIRLLQKAGHNVQTARGAGMLGRSDPVQFAMAIQEGRVCLSANYGDFEELHLLVKKAQGNHPGILVVREDNDPTRDLTSKGIVAAIRKLEAAGVPIANEYIILNHWR